MNGRESAALLSAGQPIPTPVGVRALLDTGTDVTCVAPRVFNQLRLTSMGSVSTQTVCSSINADLFEVSLSIPAPPGKAGPMLVREQLVVMELINAPQNCEALIGMDILAECLLILDGPGRQFTIGF
jgi:hypothetical protein